MEHGYWRGGSYVATERGKILGVAAAAGGSAMLWTGSTSELLGASKSWTLALGKFSLSFVKGEEGGFGLMASYSEGVDVGISEGKVWTDEATITGGPKDERY